MGCKPKNNVVPFFHYYIERLMDRNDPQKHLIKLTEPAVDYTIQRIINPI
jgi:hypothetical protein